MAATTFAPAARLGAPRAAPAAPVKKIGRPAALVVFRRGAALAAPLSRRPVRAAAGETETAAAGPVTDATWDEAVLKADVPVLVDFWAPWCGPCRMIAPIIDELAVEYKGKIKAYKLNTDESPSIATEYGIRSIPTVMLFKGGQKVEVVIGAVPKSSLVQTVEKYL